MGRIDELRSQEAYDKYSLYKAQLLEEISVGPEKEKRHEQALSLNRHLEGVRREISLLLPH